jgi:transcriptional regulator of arginine metabolism
MQFYSSHPIIMQPVGGIVVSRSRRLTVLARLLSGQHFSSQEELARALARAGAPVTQATLSRDLRSLGVGKRPDANGKAIYALPAPATETLDRERRLLDLRAFVNEVSVAQNLIVVKTPPGHAHGVGRAIDLADLGDVVGSVAGDDTVLVVASDAAAARRVKRHLDDVASRETGGAQ